MGGDLFSLFLVWLLSKCRSGGAGEEYEPALPGGQPGWPGSPISTGPMFPASTAPAWPAAATQTGVPAFPGVAWEFDEPPPPEVQARARQLVDQLWATGTGSFRIERTNGRSIAYQAQVVASGRKGVVAYRLKGQRAAVPYPLPNQATAARPQAPRVLPRAAQPRPAQPRPEAARSRPSPAAPRPSAAPPASSSPRPVAAPAAPPVQVVPSKLNLPELRRGWGIKPAPPNKDVMLLQQRLGISSDGRFGADTDAAVRDYQRRNGLKVDGIVGEKTWASLFAVRA